MQITRYQEHEKHEGRASTNDENGKKSLLAWDVLVDVREPKSSDCKGSPRCEEYRRYLWMQFHQPASLSELEVILPTDVNRPFALRNPEDHFSKVMVT
jgi:hypothetical protein